MPRIAPTLLAAALALAAPAAAQGGWPAETGDAVTDLADVITAEHEDSIRAMLSQLRATAGVDARVVTISAMRDYPVGASTIESFATGLFNAWEIDDAASNDGVLLLVSVGDRQVRVELGDGAPPHMDARARTLVDEYVLPHFRRGEMSAGIVSGAEGIVRSFGVASSSGAAPAYSAPASGTTAVDPPSYVPPPSTGRDSGGGGGGVPTGIAAVGAMVLGVFGIGAYGRHRKRKCPECGTQMTRLDEASDDVYLDSGQKAEETLRSVDYDVWKCGACGRHALLPYRAWFSASHDCPSCRYRTVRVKRSTLQSPTYTSTGSERVERDCRHCRWHDERVVVLPRLQRSSSSSSSGSRSSSGGGSSSGRGASGSW